MKPFERPTPEPRSLPSGPHASKPGAARTNQRALHRKFPVPLLAALLLPAWSCASDDPSTASPDSNGIMRDDGGSNRDAWVDDAHGDDAWISDAWVNDAGVDTADATTTTTSTGTPAPAVTITFYETCPEAPPCFIFAHLTALSSDVAKPLLSCDAQGCDPASAGWEQLNVDGQWIRKRSPLPPASLVQMPGENTWSEILSTDLYGSVRAVVWFAESGGPVEIASNVVDLPLCGTPATPPCLTEGAACRIVPEGETGETGETGQTVTAGRCGAGLSCCYPCGIPGCEDVCEPTCDPNSSTQPCIDGCIAHP
ncbi:MAG: hypothetical protein H6729_05185 [Deltaproteobacteria bacterium]|nr:hypothetical protein [Deltaproteobacteria bacterium]